MEAATPVLVGNFVVYRISVGSVYANHKGNSDQTSLVLILNIWVIIIGGDCSCDSQHTESTQVYRTGKMKGLSHAQISAAAPYDWRELAPVRCVVHTQHVCSLLVQGGVPPHTPNLCKTRHTYSVYLPYR
jgi:hypothetical protein